MTDIKKFTRGIQSHIWAGRKTNQWTWSQDDENYQVWGTANKKTEQKWIEPKGPVGLHQVNQHMCRGSPRLGCKREKTEYLKK